MTQKRRRPDGRRVAGPADSTDTTSGLDVSEGADAVGRLSDANEEPNAIIYSPRTARELAKP
jgi:hypothetical protein